MTVITPQRSLLGTNSADLRNEVDRVLTRILLKQAQTDVSPGISVKTVTSNYLATASDSVLLANGALTITLPRDASSGKTYRIKRIGAGNVTIAPSGTTIDGAANYVLTVLYQSADAVYDGTAANWSVF